MNIIAVHWILKTKIKKAFYKAVFGRSLSLAKGMNFRDNFHLWLEPGAKITIGNSFFNNDCSLCAREEIKIGDNCLFGENVRIYDNNHIFKYTEKPIEQQGFKSEKLTIGSNCWIGTGCILLKGTRIGDNCVISAGQVINGVIPANTLVKLDGSLEQIGSRGAGASGACVW